MGIRDNLLQLAEDEGKCHAWQIAEQWRNTISDITEATQEHSNARLHCMGLLEELNSVLSEMLRNP